MDIDHLIQNTNILIEDCIKDFTETLTGDEKVKYEEAKTEEEAIQQEERRLEADPATACKQMEELRDQMILNELEIQHPERYEELKALFAAYISDQLEVFRKDLAENLFFLDRNDSEFRSRKDDLIKNHKRSFEETVNEENLNLPSLLLDHGCELFVQQALEAARGDQPELIDDAVEKEYIEEWEKFIHNSNEDIKNGEWKFWDQAIFQNEYEYVSNYLALFLYVQDIKNEKEDIELKK